MGDGMKQGIKNIFPAFLSLVNILNFEILNNIDAIRLNIKFDLQLISNVLLIMLAVYSVLRIIVELKQGCRLLEVHYLNNLLIVVSAFVLNIKIFENKITKFVDFFTGWHTLWFVWFCILFFCFTGLGEKIYIIFRNMIQNIENGIKSFKTWATESIRRSNKGMVLLVISGLVLWFVLLKFMLEGKNEVPVEILLKKSLIFWCGWFVIWMLILFFINFLPQIGPSVKNRLSGKIIEVCIWIAIGVVTMFVTLKVFPIILSVLGSLLLFTIIIFLLISTIIYKKRKKLVDIFMVNGEDLIVILGIFVLVTFIFLPIAGTISTEGKLSNVEDFKTYMELIIAGIELVKKFL